MVKMGVSIVPLHFISIIAKVSLKYASAHHIVYVLDRDHAKTIYI